MSFFKAFFLCVMDALFIQLSRLIVLHWKLKSGTVCMKQCFLIPRIAGVVQVICMRSELRIAILTVIVRFGISCTHLSQLFPLCIVRYF